MSLGVERREQILEVLGSEGRVVASELSDRLGVSLDTVRRDLDELAGAGMLRRVRGGGLPPSPSSPRFVERAEIDVPVKRSIAGTAIERLVAADQVVALGGGTTVREVARLLPDSLHATVLTTAPDVAVDLLDRPGLDVHLIGGPVHRESRTVVGVDVIDALSDVRPDVCLLGACSVDPDVGITVMHREEVLVVRALMRASSRTAILAASPKLGTAAQWVVGGIDEVDVLVTDADAPPDAIARFERAGVEVVVAR
jgi:DeoR/GlpR family transcriptional regulator of sugar metabolism